MQYAPSKSSSQPGTRKVHIDFLKAFYSFLTRKTNKNWGEIIAARSFWHAFTKLVEKSAREERGNDAL